MGVSMSSKLIYGSFVSLLALAASAPAAFAQSAAAPDDGATQSEQPGDVIVVTARKREENILKTPVAVSAFDSAALEARGIDSLQDLADFTPGMSINSAASGRSDRSFQSIIIRGFTPSVSTIQTTSVFIDGVPVSSPTAIQNLGDPARVEVIKGPQSAYFGRQTFAGAVNVVTKDTPEELSGSIVGMFGTRQNRELAVEIGGPLAGDILGFRATGRYWAKDGSYKNQGVRGQTLGDQETRAGTMQLTFKPSSTLTAKAFGLWSENHDGPNATALISARGLNDAAGNVVVANQSNCRFGNNPYICGTLPGLSAQQPSANTVNTPYIKGILANPNGRLLNPEDGTKGYGLRSRYYHAHLSVDWEASDSLTLSSLTGYNDEIKSQISDLKVWYNGSIPSPFATATNGLPTYFDYPYIVEFHQKDFSQELRASFDNKGPFRAILGVSYLNAFFQSGGGGTPRALTGTQTFATVSGASRAKTYGAFFGLTYEATDKLSLSVDGRYQIDKIAAYARPGGQTLISDAFAPAGFYAEGETLASETYKNFMPRAIINYQFSPSTMAYASYSKGINPSVFNTVFLSRPASTQVEAARQGLQIETKPEKLDNYEVGLKGRALDNKLIYTLAAYYGTWKNQLNANQITIVNPLTNVPDTFQAQRNTGKVRVKGVEVELTAYPVARVMLNASGAINDTEILELSAPAVTLLTGITDFRGNQNPLTPKYTGSFSAQYSVPIPSLDEGEAFLRGDFAYKSGVYTNGANTTKTPDYKQVNLRAGLKTANVLFEGFVTNVFNDRAYNSAIDYNLIDPSLAYLGVSSAVAVGLRELRTYGLRIRYSF